MNSKDLVRSGQALPPTDDTGGGHKWTPGPWEYVASSEHHGPYITTAAEMTYGDIADCYVMSKPDALSTRNGGDSHPIHHQRERADANARLIAAAPELYEAMSLLLGEAEFAVKYVPEAAQTLKTRMLDAITLSTEALSKARGEQL